MLPKKKRLDTAAFNRFFSSGKRYHSPLLTIVYAPHPTFHASVVVGKKVYKKAVARNKLRRQLYNTLYHQQNTGVYIIVTKPAVKTVSVAEVRAELLKLLQKIESGTKSR